jgi:hypothetical protein
MNYTSFKSIFYSFLFFTVSLQASWSSLCLTSLPFPLTVGLIYQVGKSDWNFSIKSYLYQKHDCSYYKPVNFVGYTGERVIDKNENFIFTYMGLPLLVFIAGSFSSILATKLSSRQDYFISCLGGFALTMAWAYGAPYLVNPFLWKRCDGRLVNKVIRLG